MSLSDKIEVNNESISHHDPKGDRELDFILVKDVKDFIRSIKKHSLIDGWQIIRVADILRIIDELAGERLI